MRLIDADDFIKKLAIAPLVQEAMRKAFNHMPTVDVVRCKDCKYYLNSNETCQLIDTRLHFYETNNVWTEDSFCSWGGRKEQ